MKTTAPSDDGGAPSLLRRHRTRPSLMEAVSCLCALLLASSPAAVGAFSAPLPPRPAAAAAAAEAEAEAGPAAPPSRRDALGRLGMGLGLLLPAAALAVPAFVAGFPVPASAAVDVSELVQAQEAAAPVPLKTFIDPEGLFALEVPQGYYTLRRKAKGDLPDEKTGAGRRGSSIFTAGNMAKAEVLAVERFPTRVLLEDAGVDPASIPPDADLGTIRKLGDPAAVAELLAQRRDKDKSGSNSSKSRLDRDSVRVSEDGRTLTFQVRIQIDVQKPELLMEQMGVSELYRVTVARATLEAGDGNLMAAFGSALQQDFDGPDGEALRRSVDSFRALSRE